MEFDPLTGAKTDTFRQTRIYANSHYVTPKPTLDQAIRRIEVELQERLAELKTTGRLLEAQGQELAEGGGGLQQLASLELSGLAQWNRQIKIRVACDVTNPLTGPTGAADADPGREVGHRPAPWVTVPSPMTTKDSRSTLLWASAAWAVRRAAW